MRLPITWMGEYVDLSGVDAEALADRLALSGTAVEDVHHGALAGDGSSGFRVGHVVSVDPHPDADRLRVCQVDVGDGPQQIVCGAPNVAADQRVPVALPGAVMPSGQRLGVAKLRGVESNGMICSASELGVGGDADGIMVLADDLSPGTPLGEALPAAAETVLELELTSNRPDCMSIAGMARETAAVLDVAHTPPPIRPPEALASGEIGDLVSLTVDAPDLCPRYMARAFLDVEVGPSPPWLAARIESAGMRSISNVVDVTNYVMLLTGQPLHAFDLDRMAGPTIIVRRARDGEKVTTLDDVERTLDSSMLAICDAEAPGVIAGVMGAADVEVSESTTRVLLEAANFNGPNIITTSLALGLRSESSSRFEKGLPPRLTEVGLDMASELLVALCGASLVPGTLDAREQLPEPATLRLRHARTDLLLGDAVDPVEAAAILRRLGCEVAEGAEAHEVTVPWHRAGDLTREADLIEEVGRVRGYDRIAPRLPRTSGAGRRSPSQEITEHLADRATTRGYHQAITYSMVPDDEADRLRMAVDDPRREVVRLAHPLSEEMGVMRRSMLPGLLRAAARNQSHQIPSGALFEIGRTYAPAAGGLADEKLWFASLAFGAPGGDHWRRAPEPVDFFTAKGLIEDLAASAGLTLRAEANEATYFSPGRQARMLAGDAVIGWAAEVHPLVLREFDVKGPTAAVVLDIAALVAAAGESVQFEDLLSVPASRRDLALVVGDDVPAGEIVATARAAGPLVRDAAVFDLYRGDQVPAGKVSLAVRLLIADPERTLTDDEIDGAVAAAVADLASAHGAELRT